MTAPAEIKIHYENMARMQGWAREKARKAQLMHQRLSDHLRTLRVGAWVSPASDKCYREIEDILAGIDRFSRALTRMDETLAIIIHKFQEAEQAGKDGIEAIPMDGVVVIRKRETSNNYGVSDRNKVDFHSEILSTTDSSRGEPSLLGGFNLKRRAGSRKGLEDAEQQLQTEDTPDPTYEAFMQAEPGDTVTLPNGLTVVIPNDAAFHEHKEFFYSLLTQSWAYDGSLTLYLDSDERVQAITDGRDGAENVNLDYYSVTLRVDATTAQAIYEDMVNSPQTMGGQDETSTAAFNRRPGDDDVTQEGDVFDLDMPAAGLQDIGRFLGPQNGAVVVARAEDDYAVMQTIMTPSYGEGPSEQNHGYHPVNGARAFGYNDNGDGTYTFYTMGADTPNNDLAGNIIGFARSQQDENWRNWQDSMENYARTNDYEITERQEWRNYTEGWGIFSLNQTNDHSDD